jgi:coenzyme PQQ precursor peptide PqqA
MIVTRCPTLTLRDRWLTGAGGRLAGGGQKAMEGMTMKWKTPVIVEIAVGLEINAYACAEVE